MTTSAHSSTVIAKGKIKRGKLILQGIMCGHNRDNDHSTALWSERSMMKFWIPFMVWFLPFLKGHRGNRKHSKGDEDNQMQGTASIGGPIKQTQKFKIGKQTTKWDTKQTYKDGTMWRGLRRINILTRSGIKYNNRAWSADHGGECVCLFVGMCVEIRWNYLKARYSTVKRCVGSSPSMCIIYETLSCPCTLKDYIDSKQTCTC